MKIGYLGAGVWGFALASLLASKGHRVVSWTIEADVVQHLKTHGEHPRFAGVQAHETMSFTTNIEEALTGANMIVESVTASGMRTVFEQIRELGVPECPIVMTSKGIEQGTGYILPEVVIEILGDKHRSHVGLISGPSFAAEVIRGLPASVAGSAYDHDVMMIICEAFTTPTFRVYPNPDVKGVAYGGALKNIIAIACGIAEGLKLGQSAKAALMTRGLHEIRKLAITLGCQAETLYGLSGMGDLCLTCSSPMSRNYRFGSMISEGRTPEEARREIGTVVEGAYTCVSALELCQQSQVAMPITEMVYKILKEGMQPIEAVKGLMQRSIKEEYL